MPEEQGVVIKTYGKRALVRTQRGGACDGCKASGACLTLSGAHEVVEVEAYNGFGARAGEHVVLRLSDRAFLGASLGMYFVPVVALVAGVWLGGRVAAKFHVDPNLYGFFSGIALCGAAIALVRLLVNSMPSLRESLRPEIVARAHPPEPGDSCSLSSGNSRS